jgi:hypothetical protein
MATNQPRNPIYEAWKQEPAWVLLAGWGLVSFVLTITGMCLDPRSSSDAYLWIKPCKFSVSIASYAVSLLWLSRYITGHAKLLRATAVAACIGGVLELSGILLQTIHGIKLHFDATTAESLCISMVVRFAILPVAMAALIVYCLLAKQRNLPPVVGLSMKWGMFLTIIGFIPGMMMLMPGLIPGHAHGVPFLGWSTVSGDLRAAHFVGIHALQILPIIGCLIKRHCWRLTTRRQEALVSNAGITYLCIVSLLCWQALRSESLFAPSALTASCLAIIVIGSVTMAFVYCSDRYAADVC